MAEDKTKKVVVKALAKAFLTTKPEENDILIDRPVRKKMTGKVQKSVAKASEVAASISANALHKEVEVAPVKEEPKKVVSVAFVEKETPVFRTKTRLTEDGRVKKIPACKKVDPMKRPADETLIITGKVMAASNRIQTPVAATKAVTKKAEPVKEEVKAPEVAPVVAKEVTKKEASATKKEVVKKEAPAAKKEAVKKTAAPAAKKEAVKKTAAPAAKKEAVKKTAAPAAKKEAVKKVAAPAAKKETVKKVAAPAQHLYIQYQNGSYEEAALIEEAKKYWTNNMKEKAADLKTLALYVKPQEKMVYCVFNEKKTGAFGI